LQGFLNYTYQDAHDFNQAGVDSQAANLPQNMFNYGLTYNVDKFQAALLGHILGDVPTSSKKYPKLDSYHLVDLHFNYRAAENINYFLHINNKGSNHSLNTMVRPLKVQVKCISRYYKF
jgi:outer membrane receptor protein involved in Fe transport